MGGTAGKAMAFVGAVENQKTEGVMHVHFFLYLVNLFQFNTLSEIAQQLQKKWISIDAMKRFFLVMCDAPLTQAFRNLQTSKQI